MPLLGFDIWPNLTLAAPTPGFRGIENEEQGSISEAGCAVNVVSERATCRQAREGVPAIPRIGHANARTGGTIDQTCAKHDDHGVVELAKAQVLNRTPMPPIAEIVVNVEAPRYRMNAFMLMWVVLHSEVFGILGCTDNWGG